MPDRRPSVVIVDDHPVFRHGLATLLAEDGIDVLSQAGTVAEAMTAVAAHRPDVVILDLHLPDGTGVQATRRLLADNPNTRILILTMDSADATTVAALRSGARGYLLKETAAESISSTVVALMRGELVLDSRLADRIGGLLARADIAGPELERVTARELEVLTLVADGLSNIQIGRRLFLAEKTVRNNVTALLAKTGQPSRPALIAFARNRGLGGAASAEFIQ